MKKRTLYKLVTYIPQTHLEQLRILACNAGAGRIGKYDTCTFMTSGIGTYRPLKGAKPYQGEVNKTERIGEAKFETYAGKSALNAVIKAIKKVHPYEEPVIEVYPVELR